ncbi:MAG: FAD-dependent oxidoreductase [Spirochaetes bacterium]|nr:FAD-dependent oxidoreductase [Spirochaetota bacterium]
MKHPLLQLGLTLLLLQSVFSAEILVEAESFREKGGWAVDQQFMDVMGSPFLLAHGLGIPVADAVTSMTVPADGVYHVRVRTRNWVPGPWTAPGRFRVSVNGTSLHPEFGTVDGWSWQDGGTVSLKAGQARIALHDSTGFDGRCDALYFTTENTAPPDDTAAMRRWRNSLRGLSGKPASGGSFDLVIVGGGIAGCAAALAAGEAGLRTALIHDRPVLGGNASGEVRVHTIGITANADAILRKINTKHWPNGSSEALLDDKKRHASMAAAKGVSLLLNWRAYDVAMNGKRIAAVYAEHIETGETRAFTAPVFVDSTGDGWIGFWAGAEFRTGREAAGEFGEAWDERGELWSPEKPDNRVMGASLLWNAKPLKEASSFPDVPWALPVAKGKTAVSGDWQYEYSANDLDQITDAEAIRDHILRAIYGSFANAKAQPKYAQHRLEFVGYVLGKRESRRLMGDYIYTFNDAKEGRDFPDTVAEEKREIDVHYQRQYKDAAFPYDFISEAMFMKVPRYRIPFRTLYSRNIGNLMMAGRCFSCSHIGLGGPRVMNTTGQMGVAVGYAAGICKKYSVLPRGVYEQHLDELLRLTRRSADTAETNVSAAVQAPDDPTARTVDQFTVKELPDALRTAIRVAAVRGDYGHPAAGFSVKTRVPVTAYLAVHDRGGYTPPAPWKITDMTLDWSKGKDRVYRASFPAGSIDVPPHSGRNDAKQYGIPHLLFLMSDREEPVTVDIVGVK